MLESMDELTKDAQLLLDRLPVDGTSRSNRHLREELRWDVERYWPAQTLLRSSGYAQAGRGQGGSLKRLIGDRHHMLAAIPVDGAPIGNKALQGRLGWTANKYWKVRDDLIDAGVIEKGRGQGGSVRRVIDPELDDPSSVDPDKVDAEYEAEKHLYPPIESVLRGDWAKDERLTRFVVEVTAHQGRRQTGGKWTRPDLTVLSHRRFPLTNQMVFDVTTFEVKRAGDWDVTAIYEASAHSARATYSYAILHHKGPITDKLSQLLERCKSEAARLGVGIIITSAPADYAQWDFIIDAVRQTPVPEELENFIATQITDDGKEVVRKWWADTQ